MNVIAVVDDEESVRRSMERLLRAAGYRVMLFPGGAEFVDSLERERPACALVDGKMPGMDGRAVLAHLSRQRIPAIVVSGHDSPEDRNAAARLGARAFFSKPYDPDALLKTIADTIARPTP